MESVISRPSKDEQAIAMESYKPLISVLDQLSERNPEIEIEETGQTIKIPIRALKLLAGILKATSEGKTVNVVPVESELTTQAAADLIQCSRPHLVKLLEEGVIPYTKVGRHRRIKFDNVIAYRKKMKEEQQQRIIEMMRVDEELGLYDQEL